MTPERERLVRAERRAGKAYAKPGGALSAVTKLEKWQAACDALDAYDAAHPEEDK